jgi:hypothetical protein
MVTDRGGTNLDAQKALFARFTQERPHVSFEFSPNPPVLFEHALAQAERGGLILRGRDRSPGLLNAALLPAQNGRYQALLVVRTGGRVRSGAGTADLCSEAEYERAQYGPPGQHQAVTPSTR